MDWEGILKAWTTKVVPKRARITVTRSDSIYSPTEVCARASARSTSVRCSATGAISVIFCTTSRCLTLLHPRGAARAPAPPRIVRLPSYWNLCRSRSPARAHPLASRRSSDDQARPHGPLHTGPKAILSPEEIPVAWTYGRLTPARFLPPQWSSPAGPASQTTAPQQDLRPDKSPPPEPQTRRRATRASLSHRFFPRLCRGGGNCPRPNDAPQYRATPRLPIVRGSWTIVPRSRSQRCRPDTR